MEGAQEEDRIAEFRAKMKALQERKTKKQEEQMAAEAAAAGEVAPPPEVTPAEAPLTPEQIEAAKQRSIEHSVYVGSVDWSVKKEQLERYFQACGTIKRATIAVDHFTHKPKGYAYIEFAELSGVENALRLNEHLLAGRTIKVTRKRENKPIPYRRPRRRFRRI
jgi:polyadenylate-binding protein 2